MSVSSALTTKVIESEAAMMELGAALFDKVQAGDVLLLRGDLGAGKSVFARGFVRSGAAPLGLDDPTFEVPSPTFTLVQTYAAKSFDIWHFDLYRIERKEELWELGLEEALDDGVVLVEWPERALSFFPEARLEIHIDQIEGGSARQVAFIGDDSWKERLGNV